MSRYFAHPLSHMVKVPDSMTWEELAVTEPLVIALHALHSLKLKKGEHIVIIGAGAIGMLAGMAALAYGGIPIMADIVDQRLELAKTFGIKYTVNPQTEDAPGYIREVTGGRSVYPRCLVPPPQSETPWTMPRRQAEWRSPDGPTGR